MGNSYLLPLFLAGSILLVLFIFFLVAYLIVHKNKQNSFLLEKTALLLEQKTKIFQAKLEENERTITSISKELHDNVGQILGFARMNMRILESDTREDQKTIETVNGMLDDAMNIVRDLSHSLNGEFIKGKGLLTVLTEELDRLQLASCLMITLTAQGNPYRLQHAEELAVFRIAQEAMTNTLRHSKATALQVSLQYESDRFGFCFRDNGVGLDKPGERSTQSGIGFINMRERAAAIGATLIIQSSTHSGTELLLSLPVAQEIRNEPTARFQQ